MDDDIRDWEPHTLAGVPNQPKTPQHNFRCPDRIWLAAKKKARRHGETVTDVLVRALEEYIADDDA